MGGRIYQRAYYNNKSKYIEMQQELPQLQQQHQQQQQQQQMAHQAAQPAPSSFTNIASTTHSGVPVRLKIGSASLTIGADLIGQIVFEKWFTASSNTGDDVTVATGAAQQKWITLFSLSEKDVRLYVSVLQTHFQVTFLENQKHHHSTEIGDGTLWFVVPSFMILELCNMTEPLSVSMLILVCCSLFDILLIHIVLP